MNISALIAAAHIAFRIGIVGNVEVWQIDKQTVYVKDQVVVSKTTSKMFDPPPAPTPEDEETITSLFAAQGLVEGSCFEVLNEHGRKTEYFKVDKIDELLGQKQEYLHVLTSDTDGDKITYAFVLPEEGEDYDLVLDNACQSYYKELQSKKGEANDKHRQKRT